MNLQDILDKLTRNRTIKGKPDIHKNAQKEHRITRPSWRQLV
ncbi:hypothetical protein SynSYN20_00786 [Synechococcus sp. SYN20]|nr:hypothetical protein SynSYN20_00786 [Synechococcus sp. SYN20]